jgi:HPt (histidine-containing phosphotransfer) domain-containing protein
MKGSAGAGSAPRLGDSASELEQAVRNGDPDAAGLAGLLRRVIDAFDEVREALARLGFPS